MGDDDALDIYPVRCRAAVRAMGSLTPAANKMVNFTLSVARCTPFRSLESVSRLSNGMDRIQEHLQ